MGLFKGIFALIFFAIIAVGLYAAVSDFTGNDYFNLDPNSLIAQGRDALTKQTGFNLFKKPVKYKFAVMSDTHSDTEETAKAIVKAKSLGVQMVVVIGDLTQVGSIDELAVQKKLFDDSGVDYHVIPGDHDLYNSAGPGNFKQMFGYTNESFVKDGIHFLTLDASDSSRGLGEAQTKWAMDELKNKTAPVSFVFMHLPPYHASSPRTLYQKGLKGDEINQTAKEEVNNLLMAMAQDNAFQVFSGDHHLSNRYQEPNSKVYINIIGATTRDRNLQTPRFSLVEVFDDNTFAITDIEIDKQ